MKPLALIAPLLLATMLRAEIRTGPTVGQQAADFRATDQNGREQTLHAALGPKGGLLVFYRSADW
jgi:hypothetical protein